MRTKKVRVAGIRGMAALASLVIAGALFLVVPSAPAEEANSKNKGDTEETWDKTSRVSGGAWAEDHSVASGNAVAKHGSTASGCSTAINKSTASGAECPKKVKEKEEEEDEDEPEVIVVKKEHRVVAPVAVPRRAVARFAG